MDEKVIEEALSKIGEQVQRGEALGLIPELNGDDEKMLYSLGYSLYEKGDLRQGEMVFRKLVVQWPLRQKYWFGLASVLQLQKKYAHALTSWSMACLLDDEDPTPHFHAAECLLSLEERDEALEALKACEMRIETENHPLRPKIAALREGNDAN